jgi:excisionase family DNA binding protein
MLMMERDPRELPREGDWLTAAAAAKEKGVSRQYVARAIKRGELRGLRWGRFFVVHKADVQAWVPSKRGRPRKER